MKRLARRKLDGTGDQWRRLPQRLRLVPHGGWINAIRGAVGMSQADLGLRLGVRGSTVAKIEKSERGRTIQLETLQRAANALGCDVVYALVPRRPLQTMVDEQRLALFSEIVARADHHMSLEGQSTSDPDWRSHLLRQAEEVILDAHLWRIEPGPADVPELSVAAIESMRSQVKQDDYHPTRTLIPGL